MPWWGRGQVRMALGQVMCRIRRGGGGPGLSRYLCSNCAVDGRDGRGGEDAFIEGLRQRSARKGCGRRRLQGPDPRV